MKKIKIIFFSCIFISGCDYLSFSSKQTITMPVYGECLSVLERFVDSTTDSSIRFNIEEFDIKSDAHPFIVGFISMEGKSGKDFDLHKNAAKLICMPSGMISMKRSENNLNILMKDFDRESSVGDAYLNVDNNTIKVFYNEKNLSWWKNNKK